ncbi:MAG TPA: hypothetical protein VJU86_05970 [Pyrinomonadaceae bacterium]|nr:hypothetical protein [Pyrinomonadaceae bacterium]
MGYRRSKDNIEAARNWSTFRNSRVVEAVGLPEAVTESLNHWDDFLMHGYLDHHDHPTRFIVDELSDEQYSALLQFVDSYFASGYEYFTPLALRDEDRRRLEMRYRTR